MPDLIDIPALAAELVAAHDAGGAIATPPSARFSEFDLASAYRVEREIAHFREQSGQTVCGLKVGFANKAIWRVLKLDTIAWASMYSNTVHYAPGGQGRFPLGPRTPQRVEPEIVFSLKRPIAADIADPIALLRDHVEWIALGFEIIDCPFADFKFQPADFVAALGLHRALIVGEPLPIAEAAVSELTGQLATFTLRLLKNGELAEEGAGRNSLRSPAACVVELGAALSRQRAQTGEVRPVGNLVSSGSLTTARDVVSGETWRAEISGLPVKALEVTFSQAAV